ncbi:hypothetical protein B0T10DRAFT_473052 [Thelonectria olida]|uniref:C3H1-type domain-containing protein n=1 Tax=Thelonectria olida TaxID=1576542 RepID=A0A9P8WGB4_9HYPO|nr:hypothetical protein B0T10DRAFT_473052 [Thelonectria olida]
MSEEEKDLLARISQLAGQINRHKNGQTAQRQPANHYHAHHRHNTYRHASSPYSARGHRVGRPPATHPNRTLHLNAGAGAANSRSSSNGPDTPPAGWVARNDRHRQLINANVYEKDTQNRAKAIEATRQRKMSSHRQREKTKFNEYLKSQIRASSATTNPTGRNEIIVEGVHFRVMDGGKKLVKIAGAPNSSSQTPKSTIVAGVKFYRTKTGNLIANRIVNDQRRSGVVKKTNEPCKVFSTTGNFSFRDWSRLPITELDRPGEDRIILTIPPLGSCRKGPRCRYLHDPNKVAICKDFLKEGKCANGECCDLSHELTPERTPNCVHFAKGNCTKSDCPYTHSRASPSAPVCRAFGFNGYCEKGADCTDRHVFECPDFSNTGKCKVKGCKLLHRERASVLRSQAKSDEVMEDLSSDDEGADSDDVDSDEVAEFLEADSDASDFEDAKDFLSI